MAGLREMIEPERSRLLVLPHVAKALAKCDHAPLTEQSTGRYARRAGHDLPLRVSCGAR